MTKFVIPPKEEVLTPGEEKQIAKIRAFDRIYREPQNFEHIELICLWNHGDYKIFKYETYDWKDVEIKIKKSDYVVAREDNYRHVKIETEILPFEKEEWEDKWANY